MLEGQVYDAVRRGGRLLKAVEVVKVARRTSAPAADGDGSFVRAGQPDDLVPGFEELGYDGRTDVPGRTGYEGLAWQDLPLAWAGRP